MPSCLFRWDNQPQSRSCVRAAGFASGESLIPDARTRAASAVTEAADASRSSPTPAREPLPPSPRQRTQLPSGPFQARCSALRVAQLCLLGENRSRGRGRGHGRGRGRHPASGSGPGPGIRLRPPVPVPAPYPFDRAASTRSDGRMYFQCFLSQRLGPLSLQPNTRSPGSQNTRTCM